jgi:hypothetical protein
MSAASDLVRDAFRTQERGLDLRSGLAGASAGVGPLAVGLAIDEPVAGLVAAIGGLNAALCVPRARLGVRAWWAALLLLGGTAALALADAGTSSDAGLVLLSAAWAALWAFFRAAGPTGALLGFAVSAMLVIFAGLPATAPLGERLGWLVLGMVPGAVVMVLARRASPGEVFAGREALRPVRDAPLHDRTLQAHSLRLAIAVAAGTLLYRVADLPHGYWVPLTILAVLQPTVRSTRVRSLQRTAGTLVAGAVVVGVTFATDSRWPLVACAAAAAFFLYAVSERGYFWLVVLVTPTVLFMLSAVDFQGDTVAFDRVADSMLGILIGVVFGELAGALGELGDRAPPGRPSDPATPPSAP